MISYRTGHGRGDIEAFRKLMEQNAKEVPNSLWALIPLDKKDNREWLKQFAKDLTKLANSKDEYVGLIVGGTK